MEQIKRSLKRETSRQIPQTVVKHLSALGVYTTRGGSDVPDAGTACLHLQTEHPGGKFKQVFHEGSVQFDPLASLLKLLPCLCLNDSMKQR